MDTLFKINKGHVKDKHANLEACKVESSWPSSFFTIALP